MQDNCITNQRDQTNAIVLSDMENVTDRATRATLARERERMRDI